MDQTDKKQIFWIGSSSKDLSKLPKDIQETFNLGLVQAAQGEQHVDAYPLKGFGGNSVLEIIEDDRSGTFRAVYTIRYKKAVYVLHVFQKKSKKKIATPKEDMDLINQRLKRASEHYKEYFGSGG